MELGNVVELAVRVSAGNQGKNRGIKSLTRTI